MKHDHCDSWFPFERERERERDPSTSAGASDSILLPPLLCSQLTEKMDVGLENSKIYDPKQIVSNNLLKAIASVLKCINKKCRPDIDICGTSWEGFVIEAFTGIVVDFEALSNYCFYCEKGRTH